MIEVLAYFELRIIHTSDRKCDSPFESVEKRHGCVWVACQSNMHVCCLRFLCMCSARYYRWKWLEGHTSSAPPKHDSEVKSFIHRFRCVICENRNWKTPLYRDLRCAFQITFCDVIWHTHSLFFFFRIKIQNTHFAVVWKQSLFTWQMRIYSSIKWFAMSTNNIINFMTVEINLVDVDFQRKNWALFLTPLVSVNSTIII